MKKNIIIQEEIKMLITTAEYKYLFGDNPKEKITNDNIIQKRGSASENSDL